MIRLVLSSRPIAWFGLAIVYLIGLHFGGGSLDAFTLFELIVFAIPFAFVLFTLNDAFDHESDAINHRLRSVPNARLAREHQKIAVIVARIYALFVLLVGSAVSLRAGLSHFVFVAITVALGYAYSAPPFRLKERPVFDSLSNGAILVGILMVAFTAGSSSLEAPRQLVAIFFVGVAMHALFAIADRDPDAAARMRTIATVLGVRFAALIAFASALLLVFWGGFGAWFIIIGSHLIAGSALATLISGSTRVARWSAQIVSAYVVIFAPVYVYGLLG
jgi:4-hydroxybenzoate polyprenyltransferase